MGNRAVNAELSKTKKLNGTKFSTWKRRTKHVLFQDKVEYTLETPMPDDPGPNFNAANTRMYQRFLDDNKLARDDMLTFMEPDVEMLFEEHKIAKVTFDAISATYSSSSEFYVQMLIEKYNSSKMLDSESVVDHINKMAVIAKELATLGNLIPERMQVSTTLSIDCLIPGNK